MKNERLAVEVADPLSSESVPGTVLGRGRLNMSSGFMEREIFALSYTQHESVLPTAA